MSTFRRLLGTAQKALDQKSSGASRPGQGSDWRSLVRTAADTLTGDASPSPRPRESMPSRESAVGTPTTSLRAVPDPRTGGRPDPAGRAGDPGTAALPAEDRRAIARYDYLVRTAEPEQLERVHREAFEQLTPQQRAQLGETMRHELPEGERPRSEEPRDLARSATRLGAFDPRRLTGLLGRSGRARRGLGTGAAGAAAVGAGGLLAAVAGGAVLTSVGGSLLQEARGAGIDVDSLAPDLASELGGLAEGIGGIESIEGMEGVDGIGGFAEEFSGAEGVPGVEGLTDEMGGTVSQAGEHVSDLGDRLSGFGLDDLFGR